MRKKGWNWFLALRPLVIMVRFRGTWLKTRLLKEKWIDRNMNTKRNNPTSTTSADNKMNLRCFHLYMKCSWGSHYLTISLRIYIHVHQFGGQAFTTMHEFYMLNSWQFYSKLFNWWLHVFPRWWSMERCCHFPFVFFIDNCVYVKIWIDFFLWAFLLLLFQSM